MEGIYQLKRMNRAVGQVTVSKEGLYYKIEASLRLPKGSRYRLTVCFEHNTMDLGLCIPQGDMFIMCTKIPIKRFCGDSFTFMLSEKNERKVIPIQDNKPFSHLDILPQCSFSRENGKAVVIIHQKS